MKPLSTRKRGEGEPSPLLLSRFLPYRLSVLAAATSDALAVRYARRFGIGIPEWRVLATVGQFGPVTAQFVAGHARMGKVMVSRAATAMAAGRLLRREPNPGDRREAFLVLTPDGAAMYEAVVPLARAFEAELLSILSPAERARLDTLVSKLLAHAEQIAARPYVPVPPDVAP